MYDEENSPLYAVLETRCLNEILRRQQTREISSKAIIDKLNAIQAHVVRTPPPHTCSVLCIFICMYAV